MPLTLRTNGTGGGIVSAAWWNDFYDLLTGSMTDQAVTISNALTVTGQIIMSSANTGMEIGSLAAGNTPFIDFHSSGHSIDYDARIIANGGDTTSGDGTLNIHAANLFFLTSASYGLGINDNNPTVSIFAQAAAGQTRGLTLYGVDSSNITHAGLQVNSDGSAEVGAFNTTGSNLQLIKFFTGTTTPTTSAPDGSIWFKG